MKNQKGFTLIELLVVIAIIGILSSVVLASLNQARNKGADAAVKSNLAGTRTQAEIFYDNNTANPGTYTGLCADPTILAAINAAKSAAGDTDATVVAYATAQTSGNSVCHEGGTPSSWAISVPLKTSGTTHYCVDGAGNATTTSAVLTASDTVCG